MVFKSFDGKEIFVREWADVENPRGIVQIVHGMVEHSGRYDAFARFLNGHGFIVVADDHRGHGETDKDTLGYSAGHMFQDTVRDEGEITAHYRAKHPALTHFVLGFSYGSFLTQSYIGIYGDRTDGAVIAGSNYKKDFDVYLGSVVAHLFPEKSPPHSSNASHSAHTPKCSRTENGSPPTRKTTPPTMRTRTARSRAATDSTAIFSRG